MKRKESELPNPTTPVSEIPFRGGPSFGVNMADKEASRLIRSKLKYKRTGNLRSLAEQTHTLGTLYADREEHLLAIRSRNHSPDSERNSFISYHGEHQKAIEEYTEEYCSYEELGDIKGMMLAARVLGECHMELDQYDNALEYIQTYLQLASSADSTIEKQRAYVTLGRLHLAVCTTVSSKDAKYGKSCRECDKALSKAAELCTALKGEVSQMEYQQMRANLLINLGLLADLTDDEKTATAHYKQALNLAKKHNIYAACCLVYKNLAQMFIKKKKFDEAKLLLEASLTSAEKLSDDKTMHMKDAHKLLVLVRLELGEPIGPILDGLKKFLKTLDEADRQDLYKVAVHLHKLILAKQKVKTSNDTGKTKLLEKIGDHCSAVSASHQAIAAYQKCLDIMNRLREPREKIIPILVSLAVTHQEVKQYMDSLTFYAQESQLQRELGNFSQAAKSMLNMAVLAEQNNASIDILKRSYLQAISAAEKADRKTLYRTLDSYCETLRCYGCDEEYEQVKERMQGMGSVEEFESQDVEKEDVEYSGDEGFVLSEPDSDDEMVHEQTMVRNRPFKVWRNEVGETRLHTAIIKNRMPQFLTLLKEGHPVNISDHNGWLPLHEASNHNRVEMTKLLIERGADVNDRGGAGCEGLTALHDACSAGNTEVAEVLLDNGADVLAKCDKGMTSFDYLVTYKEHDYKACDDEMKAALDKTEDRMRDMLKQRGITPKEKKLQLPNDYDLDELILPVPAFTRSPPANRESNSSSPVYAGVVSPVKSAAAMYKEAVAIVRKSAKRTCMVSSVEPRQASPVSALIPEGETNYVMNSEDWMVNDVDSPVKKKARTTRRVPDRTVARSVSPLPEPATPEVKTSRKSELVIDETPDKNLLAGRGTPSIASQESEPLTPAFERKVSASRREQELMEDLLAMDDIGNNENQPVSLSGTVSPEATRNIEEEQQVSRELLSTLDKIANIPESQIELTESCILNYLDGISQTNKESTDHKEENPVTEGTKHTAAVKLIERSVEKVDKKIRSEIEPIIEKIETTRESKKLNKQKGSKKRSLSKEFTNSQYKTETLSKSSRKDRKENISPSAGSDSSSDEDFPEVVDETFVPACLSQSGLPDSVSTDDIVIDLDNVYTQDLRRANRKKSRIISPTPDSSDDGFIRDGKTCSQQSETILAASVSQAESKEEAPIPQAFPGVQPVLQTPIQTRGQPTSGLTASTPLYQPTITSHPVIPQHCKVNSQPSIHGLKSCDAARSHDHQLDDVKSTTLKSEVNTSSSSSYHTPIMQQTQRKLFRVEVQCGMRTLRIPVLRCESATVQWLCEEVRRRLIASNSNSSQSVLEQQLRENGVRLTADTGAELFGEDLVSHVVNDAELVIAHSLL